ncbi:hypothetical protein [Streptomyces sp. 1222.5]|uniref:hypothetical protein n=1 Tax=Streptomyces sp. 1222.5 TaxID=1881026 RepID=UPI003D75D084
MSEFSTDPVTTYWLSRIKTQQQELALAITALRTDLDRLEEVNATNMHWVTRRELTEKLQALSGEIWKTYADLMQDEAA